MQKKYREEHDARTLSRHRFILQKEERLGQKKTCCQLENRREREKEREKEKKGRKTFHAYIIPLGTSKNVEATTGNISPTFEPDAFRLNNDRIRDAIGSRWHEDAINHPRG